MRGAILVTCLTLNIFSCHSLVDDDESKCGICDSGSCDRPRDCLAGFVRDTCNCCYQCGRKEGERCNHEDVNAEGLGDCGENLECQVRSDLDWNDPPEAVCVCLQQSYLCGNDGTTYENICQLTEARYSRRDGLRSISSEPCPKASKFLNPPQSQTDTAGNSIMLTCEASGWPVPSIHWNLHRNKVTTELPGNNSRVAVRTRNGPKPDETTSWILFLSLSKEDEGRYSCHIRNDLGSAVASATVAVLAYK